MVPPLGSNTWTFSFFQFEIFPEQIPLFSKKKKKKRGAAGAEKIGKNGEKMEKMEKKFGLTKKNNLADFGILRFLRFFEVFVLCFLSLKKCFLV